MKKIVYLTLLIFILLSCSKQNEDPIFEEPTIIGLWVQDTLGEYNVVDKYLRRDSFEIEIPGLKFSDNGDFILRDKCACPDSRVENYYGNYSLPNDSIINVSYIVDSTNRKNTFKLIDLSLDTLKISFK